MPLRRKIRSGSIIAFALLMISYFLIFQYTWKVQREYNSISDSYKAENKVGELKNAIIEAETGVRGYYITKDQAFIKSFSEVEENTSSVYNELKTLAEKNPN